MLALLADTHFAELQARRREWGADKLDEVWTGIHHLRPVGPDSELQQAIALCLRPVASERGLVPVLGAYDPRDPADGRLADVGEVRLRGDQAASAVLAVEIVNAAEDVQRCLSALAADRVDELVIVDPESRNVSWFALVDGDYEPTDRSQLIDCTAGGLAEAIEWPKRDAM
jgi:hypothetical protein